MFLRDKYNVTDDHVVRHYDDAEHFGNPEDIKKLKELSLETKIIDILQNGHKNAVGLSELVKRICVNERKIRESIESLRRQGYAILIPRSKPFGYYFAESKAELDEYDVYMRHRLIEEYKTYKLVKRATKNKLGRIVQLPLDLKS